MSSPATNQLRAVFAPLLDETKRELECRLRGALTSEALSAGAGVVHVVAVGKGSPLMARVARETLGSRVASLLVVCPDGTPVEGLGQGLAEVMRAGHPVPDARSAEAAEHVLSVAEGVQPRDVFLMLLSGGASALATAPIEGVTREDLAAVTEALLHSGAPITDINAVRRHLSKTGGGRVAGVATARGGRVVTCIFADVVGKALAHDIGSGPTVPDPTTVEQARETLARSAPHWAHLPLLETMKPTDTAVASRTEARILATPDLLATLACDDLQRRGFCVTTLAQTGEPVEALGDAYASLARRLAPGDAVVRAAEPTVHVSAKRPGCGGRSCHLAALVAGRLPAGVVFLAGASDGVDGNSATAGAVVDFGFVEKTGGRRAYDESIAAFDTGSLHRAAGTALPGGPTGLNLCDLHVLARVK